MTDNQRAIATKRLNRIKIQFSDDLMRVNTFWCRVSLLETGDFNRMLHHHTFFELHYALKGNSDFYVNDKFVPLTANHFLLVTPSTQHRIARTSSDFIKFVCGFEIEFNEQNSEYPFYQYAFDNVDVLNTYPDNDIMRKLPELMLYYCFKQQSVTYSGVTYALRLLLHEIAVQLCPNKNAIPNSSQMQKYRKSNDWATKVNHFISDNIAYKLTGSVVAEQFHISLQQLNRILTAENDVTVSQLISDAKLDKISELLENTTMSLEEIAMSTGFSNEYNLNRFFTAKSGMPPGKYRISVTGSHQNREVPKKKK